MHILTTNGLIEEGEPLSEAEMEVYRHFQIHADEIPRVPYLGSTAKEAIARFMLTHYNMSMKTSDIVDAEIIQPAPEVLEAAQTERKIDENA